MSCPTVAPAAGPTTTASAIAVAEPDAGGEQGSGQDRPAVVDRPVFVLAPTWRCGSTLVQRLLTASGDVWLWGEPFDRAAPLQSLHEQLAPFGDDWPTVDHEVDPVDPATTWIALMSPAREQLLAAHRAYVRTLLAPPRPGPRWGCKEVRLGGPEVAWLLDLFPGARIVLLVRDPVAAWASFSANSGWFWRWPDHRVHTAEEFADLWAGQVASFLTVADRPECLLVRHEDVVARTVLDDLADHVGVRVPGEPLDHVLRGIDQPPGTPSPDVVARVRRLTAGPAAAVGYPAAP